MAFSTILEVTLEMTYSSQSCINRFNYLGVVSEEENPLQFAEALCKAMGYDGAAPPATGSVFKGIFAQIGLASLGVGLTAFDIWEPTDFVSFPLEEWQGVITGDTLSPTMALGFKSDRTRRDINRSTKRFVGVSEGFVASGGQLSASGLVASAAIAQELGKPLTITYQGHGYAFTPITVSKERYVVPNSSPVRYAYRYYKPRAAQLDHYAVALNWAGYTTVRTQVSRQYGSGR